jgi:hypothetical protein
LRVVAAVLVKVLAAFLAADFAVDLAAAPVAASFLADFPTFPVFAGDLVVLVFAPADLPADLAVAVRVAGLEAGLRADAIGRNSFRRPVVETGAIARKNAPGLWTDAADRSPTRPSRPSQSSSNPNPDASSPAGGPPGGHAEMSRSRPQKNGSGHGPERAVETEERLLRKSISHTTGF